VTFDIVNMVYPYNAIMGRGSINKLEAVTHDLYLCMEIQGPLEAITIYGDQLTAHNIERDFVLGQRNVHCFISEVEVHTVPCLGKAAPTKAQIQSTDQAKKVPLDALIPNQTVLISEDLTQDREAKLLSCLSRNKDVFAWSALDLVDVSRSIIEHGLSIDPFVRPKSKNSVKCRTRKLK
jgi:hypothetical protein